MAQKPPRSADPLLAQVLQNPEDDALRQVWADSLLERGDSRGEIIAIQVAAGAKPLTAAADKRVRSILSKEASSWLAELDGVVMKKAGLVFDRGLVCSCQLQIKSLAALNGAIGHPLWAAVRSVWLCDRYAWDPRLVPLLAHPTFRSLREIIGLGMNAVFAALATHERPLPFTDSDS